MLRKDFNALKEKVAQLEKAVNDLKASKHEDDTSKMYIPLKYSCTKWLNYRDVLDLINYEVFDLYINGRLIKRCCDKDVLFRLLYTKIPMDYVVKISDVLLSPITSTVDIIIPHLNAIDYIGKV